MSNLNIYQFREQVLLEIGYDNYSKYLGGELWKSIRRKVLDRDNRLCRCCGRTATQVHHQSYNRAVMLGEQLGVLVSVCAGCHKYIEFTKSGVKRSFTSAKKVCARLIKNGRNVRASPQRKKAAKVCPCGNRAFKKSRICRPCLRSLRGSGS